MSTVKIKPAEGVKLRHPVHMQHHLPEGEYTEVPDSILVRRQIRSGDAILLDNQLPEGIQTREVSSAPVSGKKATVTA